MTVFVDDNVTFFVSAVKNLYIQKNKGSSSMLAWNISIAQKAPYSGFSYY